MEDNDKMDIMIRKNVPGGDVPETLTDAAAAAALKFHKSLPGYAPTHLISLQNLAQNLGVKGIYVKDESSRFGLKAFKALGGTYAMYRILCDRLRIDPSKADFTFFQRDDIRKKTAEITFVTATDGNHGKGVSWACGLFGCKAYVYMPDGSSEERAEAVRSAGPATVEITDKNYDETVLYAKKMSEENGWILIQDTAWNGYEQIPLWIIQGYLTMARETVWELAAHRVRPTHVFLQAGVGAMAGGVCGFLMDHYRDDRPVICIAEPEAAACIFLSAQYSDGHVHSVKGNPVTIMAGLNCGTPCGITWPVLRDFVTGYFSCPDYIAAHGMRTYACPVGKDSAVVSGESGGVTMGVVRMLLEDDSMREVRNKLGMDQDSVILLINTEGDTDGEHYRNIVGKGAYPVPERQENVIHKISIMDGVK